MTVNSANGNSYRQNTGNSGGEDDSQSMEPLHFGLGAATNASVTVTWPNGVVDHSGVWTPMRF